MFKYFTIPLYKPQEDIEQLIKLWGALQRYRYFFVVPVSEPVSLTNGCFYRIILKRLKYIQRSILII